jgi:hypothetical protein
MKEVPAFESAIGNRKSAMTWLIVAHAHPKKTATNGQFIVILPD